jgi:hypothetical protein
MSMENHGGIILREKNSLFIHQSYPAVLLAVLSSSKAERTGEGNYEFCRRNYLFLTFKCYLTCRRILRYEAYEVIFPPKEGVLKIFSPLKSIALGEVWTLEPWVQLQAREPLGH